MKRRWSAPGFREPLSVRQHRTVARLEAQAGRELPQLREGLPALPKPRAPRVASGRPIEADVVKAVGDLLAAHPRVAYALRMNSGAASYEHSSGRYAPIWFHVWVRAPQPYRMSDFYGATVEGRALAFECKRPGWKHPTDEREHQQAAFLAAVRAAGGIGEFITDAEQVEAALGR